MHWQLTEIVSIAFVSNQILSEYIMKEELTFTNKCVVE